VRAVAVVAAAVVVAGCGGEEVADPGCETLESSGVSVDGAATLGLDRGGFVAIEGGAALELELGTQGGWMVRPVVEIDAAALGASDSSCVWVESTATIDGSADPVSMPQVPRFTYGGGRALSTPLLVLLSFDLEAIEGRDATITVRVEAPAAGATTSADVRLVNAE
jgi:hypothetical protein